MRQITECGGYMETIRKPRGTTDILPPESDAWNYAENIIRKTAMDFGFSEIRIPTFEEYELFHRGVGDTTDVVQKEMYTFSDKDGTVFALRPEGTAGTVRAIIENGCTSNPMPLKYYYLVNCFRYEKPQAGRTREFKQFGVEMFGAKDASADYSIISLADNVMKRLGIKKSVELNINSIGCPECRPRYRDALIKYFKAHSDKLCDNCKSRLETNPLRVLDCKNPDCKEISEGAPLTIDYLCGECSDHFNRLRELLDISGKEYRVNPKIVRGLDYYTKTVFEFVSNDIGAQGTVCGGGRYDKLMEQLGGHDLPGIGFGMGLSRLLLVMEKNGVQIPDPNPVNVYIAPLGDKAKVQAQIIANSLRESGIHAEVDIMSRSLKAQMKYADKIHAEYVVIIGDDEIAGDRAIVRKMADSSQSEISLSSIGDEILALISKK